MKNIIIAVVITVIVAGGVGFWVGTKQAPSSNTPSGQMPRGGFGARGGAGGFGGGTTGSIVSNSNGSLTIAMKDGSSKIVFVSASTTIMKTTAGSSSDLASGTNVVVIGSTNSDGSITANSIQIRPITPTN